MSNLPPGIEVVHQVMSPTFEKYHVWFNGKPIVSLHRFTGPDGFFPHDHPWDFSSLVVQGGYVEECYQPNGEQRWEIRNAGDAHKVEAEDIHRIIEIIGGECWTAVIAGPDRREVRFHRFDREQPESVPWHQMHLWETT
jgi:hypothetical protein